MMALLILFVFIVTFFLILILRAAIGFADALIVGVLRSVLGLSSLKVKCLGRLPVLIGYAKCGHVRLILLRSTPVTVISMQP
jgi:hypothetical protein